MPKFETSSINKRITTQINSSQIEEWMAAWVADLQEQFPEVVLEIRAYQGIDGAIVVSWDVPNYSTSVSIQLTLSELLKQLPSVYVG